MESIFSHSGCPKFWDFSSVYSPTVTVPHRILKDCIIDLEQKLATVWTCEICEFLCQNQHHTVSSTMENNRNCRIMQKEPPHCGTCLLDMQIK